MTQARRAVLVLALSVAACGTPSAPSADPFPNPTASMAPVATGDGAGAFCAALDQHAADAASLGELDPASSTVDQIKAAAADARTSLAALVVAFGASGLQAEFGNEFQQVEGATSGLLGAIEALPAGAASDDVAGALAAFGWPEPLLDDQAALFAELRAAACA